jgi:transcription termination factor Rho
VAGRADAEAPRDRRLNSLPPVNKTELESKHLGELHSLAAEAGVERYRMLPRTELIEKLAGGETGTEAKPKPGRSGESQRRPRGERGEKPRGGRQRKPRGPREEKPREQRPERRSEPKREPGPKPEPSIAPATTPVATTPPPSGRPKRKRRRRWGRRGSKSLRVQDLLLPAVPGRQAIVYAESRTGCTALLRGLAAELAGASSGPDPIALLIDPSPEELADWRRDAPEAEIVAAGQARHADDALAQAARRAGGGEDVIVLVDSLSRFAESYGDADGAKQLFDAGRQATTGSGTLTVVAAVERSD